MDFIELAQKSALLDFEEELEDGLTDEEIERRRELDEAERDEHEEEP